MFIKLPLKTDSIHYGTIINVAHVRRVSSEGLYTLIDFGNTVEQDRGTKRTYYDPDGKIYEYFNSLCEPEPKDVELDPLLQSIQDKGNKKTVRFMFDAKQFRKGMSDLKESKESD